MSSPNRCQCLHIADVSMSSPAFAKSPCNLKKLLRQLKKVDILKKATVTFNFIIKTSTT